jgi:ElaB/YqjD/DUF883 family membrane-anchored ribosome-binding protein
MSLQKTVCGNWRTIMTDTLVQEITNDLNDTVKRALRRLTVEARSASDLAETLTHDASAKSRRAMRIARREIRHHPAAAIALGAALGGLATFLLTRRS